MTNKICDAYTSLWWGVWLGTYLAWNVGVYIDENNILGLLFCCINVFLIGLWIVDFKWEQDFRHKHGRKSYES